MGMFTFLFRFQACFTNSVNYRRLDLLAIFNEPILAFNFDHL